MSSGLDIIVDAGSNLDKGFGGTYHMSGVTLLRDCSLEPQVVKVGSLFSGIGGLDLGLERAGMEVVYQVEKDPYCQKVLAKHWPGVPCYEDIKEIDFSTLPTVDLICGGFPCQPVSCAGKRRGDQDERWLWPEFYRAICEARPRWVLVENVPGLLSVSNGRLFGGILGDLARSWYDAEWDLLPAAAFGAPHLRFRLFLVAYARSGTGTWGPSEPGWEEARGATAGGNGEVVADSNGEVGDTKRTPGQEIFRPEAEQRPGRCSSGEPNVFNSQCHGLQGGIFQKRGKGKTDLRRRLAGPDWWLIESGICGVVDEFSEGLDGFDRVIKPLATGNPWAEEWPEVPRIAKGIPSRMDRLKCLGNAAVPQIAEWIGRRILEVDDHEERG